MLFKLGKVGCAVGLLVQSSARNVASAEEEEEEEEDLQVFMGMVWGKRKEGRKEGDLGRKGGGSGGDEGTCTKDVGKWVRVLMPR